MDWLNTKGRRRITVRVGPARRDEAENCAAFLLRGRYSIASILTFWHDTPQCMRPSWDQLFACTFTKSPETSRCGVWVLFLESARY
eukprot:4589054-Prymnesium_polylepis.1